MREQLPVLHVDLSRFTTAGHGTVHGPAAGGLSVGQWVAVTDDEADVLKAEVVAVRPGSADLQERWDGQPVVRVELSPVMRDLGVTEITDADLQAGQQLRVGDLLELVDEGEYVHRGVVEATEPARYGGLRYRVRLVSGEDDVRRP
jgi:hypothetical protein